MSAVRDLSIKWKLTWIILGTSTTALLLACVAFVGYELATFRDSMVQEVSTLASVLGENSKAALIFQDPEASSRNPGGPGKRGADRSGGGLWG